MPAFWAGDDNFTSTSRYSHRLRARRTQEITMIRIHLFPFVGFFLFLEIEMLRNRMNELQEFFVFPGTLIDVSGIATISFQNQASPSQDIENPIIKEERIHD